MYSQNNEEEIILSTVSHINNGTFLDIGAFHPIKLSNTRKLYELGWRGTYVEPSSKLMDGFRAVYGQDDRIELIQKAVAGYTGVITFFDSQGDAVGTTSKIHAVKWAEKVNYEKTQVPCLTVTDLLNESMYDEFDFVSIDAEGTDLMVLKQFDWDAINTKCVCVEYNGVDKYEYIAHMNSGGFVLISENAENLIFRRIGINESKS